MSQPTWMCITHSVIVLLTWLIHLFQHNRIQTTVDHGLCAEDKYKCETTNPSYKGGNQRSFSCYNYHMQLGK